MSMYVNTKPVRPRRQRVATRGGLLLSSGRKPVRRALEPGPARGSPPAVPRSSRQPAASPEPEELEAPGDSALSSYGISYEPTPRAPSPVQPEEGVPQPMLVDPEPEEDANDAADAARADAMMRQKPEEEQRAAAQRKKKAADEAAKKKKAAADAAAAKKKEAAAAAAKKKKPAAAAKAAAAAASTEPHPGGAITEHEFQRDMQNLRDFQSGKKQRSHPNGTPLDVMFENKRFKIYFAEVDGLLTTLTECRFDIPAHHIYKALTDFEYQKTYDEYIKHKAIIEHVDGCEIVFHELKLPNPLTNRDYVYYRKREETKKKGDANPTMFMWYQRDLPNWGKDKRPEVKGVIRAGRGDFWLQSLLESTGENSCTMMMLQQDNFAGDIPKWAMNMATKKGLPNFFKVRPYSLFCHFSSSFLVTFGLLSCLAHFRWISFRWIYFSRTSRRRQRS